METPTDIQESKRVRLDPEVPENHDSFIIEKQDEQTELIQISNQYDQTNKNNEEPAHTINPQTSVQEDKDAFHDTKEANLRLILKENNEEAVGVTEFISKYPGFEGVIKKR